MSWKVIQACTVGTSHLARGEACQDDCVAVTVTARWGEEFLVALVSDGAGSAVRGGKGASIACESGVKVIEEWFSCSESFSGLDFRVIESWVDSVRYQLWLASRSEGLVLRDFACTLLGAVVGDKGAAFFQVGDGAIVIQDGDGYKVVFWPDSGEYANTTFFVTENDVFEHLHSDVFDTSPGKVAVFSDGIQRLALVYSSRSVHKPFFEPMFARLMQARVEECDVLSEQLAHFLASPRVNERTDDDKTLVLAVRNT